HVADPLAPDCDRTLGSLAVGAQSTYTCTLTNVTASFTNAATATGTPTVGADVSATDTARVTVTPAPVVDPTAGNNPPATNPPVPNPPTVAPPVTVVAHPAITIAKDPEAQTIAKGGTATFAITVTNTGDVALTNVMVSDPATLDCARAIGTLAPGA